MKKKKLITFPSVSVIFYALDCLPIFPCLSDWLLNGSPMINAWLVCVSCFVVSCLDLVKVTELSEEKLSDNSFHFHPFWLHPTPSFLIFVLTLQTGHLFTHQFTNSTNQTSHTGFRNMIQYCSHTQNSNLEPYLRTQCNCISSKLDPRDRMLCYQILLV